MARGKLALCACVLLLAANSVSAQVILGNYPPSNDTNTTADLTNLRWKALSFSVPAGPNIPVGDLTVRLGDYDVPADNPMFQIRDHTGSTTAPGTNVLFQWTTPAPAGVAIQDYTFSAGSLFELVGGTSYWLVAVGPLGGNSDWRGSSPAITPTGIATYGGQSLFTANGGTSWGASATINSFNMVVGIPEPTSLVLAGFGVVGAWCVRRRRK
jgi:hypothetical protein